MIIPERLKTGNYVLVVAPSDSIEEKDKEYIEKSKKMLEDVGLNVEFSKYAFSNSTGYGGTVKEKAEDLNNGFKNSKYKMIMWVKGGQNSNTVFDYLDYEAIKNNPKILCGFSDATSITNVITEKTGLVTYSGPTFKSLSSWDTDYSYKKLIDTFIEKNNDADNNNNVIKGNENNNFNRDNGYNKDIGLGNKSNIDNRIECSNKTSCNNRIDCSNKIEINSEVGYNKKNYFNNIADNTNENSKFNYYDTVDSNFIAIKEGSAKGRLIGGNLSLISKLCAGKYKLNFDNKILFIEELGFESSPELCSSNLYYMKQNGVFDKISGIWVGNYEHESKIQLEKILIDVLYDDIPNQYNFPIIKSNHFGHIDKKNIIPIGIMAEINTTESVKIKFLEKIIK